MDEIELQVHHQALLSLQTELEDLQNASSESAETVVLDQSMVGRLSRMDAMQAQQMAQETARRRKLQLQKIEAALRRMEAGEYGYCVLCEEEIGAARLGIDPASTRCMSCMDV